MDDLHAAADCHRQIADALDEAAFWRNYALLRGYSVPVEKDEPRRPRLAESVPLFPRPRQGGHL